jgi:hypothetical protein
MCYVDLGELVDESDVDNRDNPVPLSADDWSKLRHKLDFQEANYSRMIERAVKLALTPSEFRVPPDRIILRRTALRSARHSLMVAMKVWELVRPPDMPRGDVLIVSPRQLRDLQEIADAAHIR